MTSEEELRSQRTDWLLSVTQDRPSRELDVSPRQLVKTKAGAKKEVAALSFISLLYGSSDSKADIINLARIQEPITIPVRGWPS